MSPVCALSVEEVVVVDRIVEEVAVLEWGPSCTTDVPLSLVPPGVREGDLLRIQLRRAPRGHRLRGGDRPLRPRSPASAGAEVLPRSNRTEHAER